MKTIVKSSSIVSSNSKHQPCQAAAAKEERLSEKGMVLGPLGSEKDTKILLHFLLETSGIREIKVQGGNWRSQAASGLGSLIRVGLAKIFVVGWQGSL